MKKEENNLDRLKGTNPFTVPEGYMEAVSYTHLTLPTILAV